MTRKQLPIGNAHQPRFKLNNMAKHGCFKRKLDLTSIKAKKAIFFFKRKKIIINKCHFGGGDGF